MSERLSPAFLSRNIASMPEASHFVYPLSTHSLRWRNGPSRGENKRMVPHRKDFTTVLSRLDFVRQSCGVSTKSAFAEWIGADSAQRVSGWESRDSLPKDGALMVCKVTGASLGWLLTGEGEPFPNGPTLFTGALPSSAEYRLRVVEDQMDAMSTVMVVCLRILSEKLPGVGPELVSALAGIPGETGSKRQLLEAAAGAAALGLRSSAQASPPVARRESAGKPQRKGR
jgi:DNA-binding transcriptional regulator YiaG